MPQPSFSSPARSTASAASRPASPQPRALAASADSRPISAAFSAGERVAEPLFSPSGAEGASVPAAGLASQIASLTSTIRSASDANSW